MLKEDLTPRVMNQKNCCQKEKIKKEIDLMKAELCGKIMKEFVELRTKTYSYLTDDNDESKKN